MIFLIIFRKDLHLKNLKIEFDNLFAFDIPKDITPN